MEDHSSLYEPWLKWAVEIQSIAQSALAYCKDVYDIERFERLRVIAAEMISHQSGIPSAKIQTLFCDETGYQTPKMDTRAAIIEAGKILLVQEKNGLWALPGGWVDVTETIASNVVKEAREETGLAVHPERLIALQEHNLHNEYRRAHNICKVFVLCRRLGGAFAPNIETIAADWFSMDALPPLARGKTTEEQLALCFAAHADPHWQPLFD